MNANVDNPGMTLKPSYQLYMNVKARPFLIHENRSKPSAEIKSVNLRSDKAKETVFRLAASVAKNVLLAADFTGWNKAPLKMTKSPDGIWHLKVNLAPGRYRYQFLIDVDSQNNPANAKRSPLPFGTLHGEVEVRS
jgi:1,4-alpha-glucan branching enzyme